MSEPLSVNKRGSLLGALLLAAGLVSTAQAQVSCNGQVLPPRAQPTPGPYVVGPAAAQANGLTPYWPTTAWQTADPTRLGFDAARLRTAVNYAGTNSVNEAILVIRRGYIAHEQYFNGFTSTTRHTSYSMAKSFVSALLGIALSQNRIPNGTSARMCSYYPANWNCANTSDLRSRITIDHAMRLMTGLQWTENWRYGAYNPDGYRATLSTVLARQATTTPGTVLRYSTGDAALLQGVIQQASGMTVTDYARQVLLNPIGLSGVQWNGATTSGISATAREYARFGYLYLNRGNWNGRQVVPASWVDTTTRGRAPGNPCTDWYYYFWHVNLPNRLGSGVSDTCSVQFCTSRVYANLPPDGYFAEGIYGQFIFVVPSYDLVVVRLARDTGGINHWDTYARELMVRILDSIVRR